MTLTPRDLLAMHDPAVLAALDGEERRQHEKLEMIASENFVSPTVLYAQGSVLTNKYAEGYPKRRYYGGCEYVDITEQLAIDRAKKLFGADHANVQPHSGAQANMAVFFALLEPGDKILGLDLSHGGHLTHGMKKNFSGLLYESHFYTVDPETETIDYDALERRAHEVQPRLIVAGASAYPRQIDWARFRAVTDAVGAYLMVDMAHIAGLVAAGLHPSPVPYADVVTSTTHKTLRGPRGGLILCKEKYRKAINAAVFPGLQGGPLEHVIAAKAVAFGEALRPEFADYQHRVLDNCHALADALTAEGFRLVSGGSDTHLLLVDCSVLGLTGHAMQEALDHVGITCNKNTIPFETLSPTVTSGIRLGTPALTTRGFTPEDLTQIGGLIGRVARLLQALLPSDTKLPELAHFLKELTPEQMEAHDPDAWDRLRREVAALVKNRPLFDDTPAKKLPR